MATLAKVCQTSSSALQPFRIQASNGGKPVSQVGYSVGRVSTCMICWVTGSRLKTLSQASASRASAAAPDNLVMRNLRSRWIDLKQSKGRSGVGRSGREDGVTLDCKPFHSAY